MGIRDDLKRANTRSYQDLIRDVLGLKTAVLERPAWTHLLLGAGLVGMIVLFGSQTGAQFIYFQF